MSEYLQLTVYMDETDSGGEVPLYEVLARRLMQKGLSGTTVLRGVMGYGTHARLHRQRLFGVSDDRPVLVIAIDRADKIRAVLPHVQSMIKEGLITLMPVEVIGGLRREEETHGD